MKLIFILLRVFPLLLLLPSCFEVSNLVDASEEQPASRDWEYNEGMLKVALRVGDVVEARHRLKELGRALEALATTPGYELKRKHYEEYRVAVEEMERFSL